MTVEKGWKDVPRGGLILEAGSAKKYETGIGEHISLSGIRRSAAIACSVGFTVRMLQSL